VYCFLAALTGSVESMGDVMVGPSSNNVLSAIRELTIELGAAAGGGDDAKASPSKSNGGSSRSQTSSADAKHGIDGTHLTRDRNVEVSLTHRLTVLRNLGLALRAQGNYTVAYICLQETMRWRANDLLEPASMPEHLFKQAWLRVRMAECCVHSFAACKQTQERNEVNQYAQRTLRVNLDSMASLESLHERRSTTFPCGSAHSAREQPLSVNARSGNWSDAAYRATDVVKKSVVLQGNAGAMDLSAAVRNAAVESDANNDWHQRMATEKDVQSPFLNLDIYDTNTPNQALNMEHASALLYSVISTLPRLPATGPLAADATVLRAQVYVNLMYVSLSLGDYAAVPWLFGEWERLLKDAEVPKTLATERVLGPLRLVANMYAAEAFLQLGQGSRALAVLDSKRLDDAATRNPIALESGFGAGSDAKRGKKSAASSTPAAFVEPEDDEDSEEDALSSSVSEIRGKRGWESSELNVKELEHALLGIASGDGDSVTTLSPARKAADAAASMVVAGDRVETGSGRYDRTGANALYAVHSGADHVNTTTDDARYHEGYPKALLLTNHAELLMQAGRFSEGLLVCKQAADAISPLELPSTQRLRLALLLKLNRYEHATQEFLNARRLPYIKGGIDS
jgi:tetratricopeptide (TPR) repeat protein